MFQVLGDKGLILTKVPSGDQPRVMYLFNSE